MTPSSGAISLDNIRTELGLSGAISLGDSVVREYSFVPSGAISMSDNYAVYKDTISSNTQNVNMKNRAVSAGWNQSAPLKHTLIINSGIIIGSSSTSTFSLDTGVTFPANSKLKITNNGYIVGAGGAGGSTPSVQCGGNGIAGGAGGVALKLQYATQIQNNSIIGGGGGGGGGGANDSDYCNYGGSGGGGAGNAIGSAGSWGAGGTSATTTNGGNGKTTEGTGGTGGSAGVNGNSATGFPAYQGTGSGGGGGGLGASGGAGGNGYYGLSLGGAGGSAGSATNGAGTYATWLATGTRYGTIG